MWAFCLTPWLAPLPIHIRMDSRANHRDPSCPGTSGILYESVDPNVLLTLEVELFQHDTGQATPDSANFYFRMVS